MSIPEKSSPPRRKRLRTLYVFLALFAAWIIAVQAGCLAMRTPDREWPAKLQQAGQSLPPVFHDVKIPDYRSIHAVSVIRPEPDSARPVIVFVHGSPGSSDAYTSYLADTALHKVADLLAIDRPGFGYTSGFGRAEGSLERQAAAIEAIVQRLGSGKKIVLVGHSLGGPVIARYAMAADCAKRVYGLK